MASLAAQTGTAIGALGDGVRAVEAIGFGLLRTVISAAHRIVGGFITILDHAEEAVYDFVSTVIDEAQEQTNGLTDDVFGAKKKGG